MTDYEKLTIKLKMVELMQNQILIRLKTSTLTEAKTLADGGDEIMEHVTNHVDKVLS